MSNIQTALITGASSGIGFELARCFARDGYRLVLVALNAPELRAAAQRLEGEFTGLQTIVLPTDLGRSEAPEQLYNTTQNQGLQIDVLVNDAGFGTIGYFSETDLKRELAIIQVNNTALVQLTKLYLRDMMARDAGRILQLASVVSFLPNPRQAVYAASKAFILSFSEALQHELKDQQSNVTVTILCPPATDTNFFKVADGEDTKVAQGSLADPKDVAEAGYKALQNGEARSLPTFGAKANFLSSVLLPDSVLAAMMNAQMETEQP